MLLEDFLQGKIICECSKMEDKDRMFKILKDIGVVVIFPSRVDFAWFDSFFIYESKLYLKLLPDNRSVFRFEEIFNESYV